MRFFSLFGDKNIVTKFITHYNLNYGKAVVYPTLSPNKQEKLINLKNIYMFTTKPEGDTVGESEKRVAKRY